MEAKTTILKFFRSNKAAEMGRQDKKINNFCEVSDAACVLHFAPIQSATKHAKAAHTQRLGNGESAPIKGVISMQSTHTEDLKKMYTVCTLY